MPSIVLRPHFLRILPDCRWPTGRLGHTVRHLMSISQRCSSPSAILRGQPTVTMYGGPSSTARHLYLQRSNKLTRHRSRPYPFIPCSCLPWWENNLPFARHFVLAQSRGNLGSTAREVYRIIGSFLGLALWRTHACKWKLARVVYLLKVVVKRVGQVGPWRVGQLLACWYSECVLTTTAPTLKVVTTVWSRILVGNFGSLTMHSLGTQTSRF